MIVKFYKYNESLGSDNLDKVLDKMNKYGFQSLSTREKMLLQAFSKGEDITNFSLDEPFSTLKNPLISIGPLNSFEDFQIGDNVVLIDTDPGKLPSEIYRYLRNNKEFIILGINDSGKLDVGARTSKGNVFYVSSKRFKLKERKPRINSAIDPLGEDDWGATVS